MATHAGADLPRLLDRIRDLGWSVAVHNDYRLNGRGFTFWLFTCGNRAAKGEGESDEDALRQVLNQIDDAPCGRQLLCGRRRDGEIDHEAQCPKRRTEGEG